MSSSIRSRSNRWWWSALLVALCALAPGLAEGAELSTEAKSQARVKYSEGNASYEQGNFREALKSFEAAYRLAPLPGFLFNVAQCHRQLGDFAQAASAYRRYLSLSEKEPANAAMVKNLIAEMDSKVRQQTAGRPASTKPVASAKTVAKDRPEAASAKPAELREGVKPGGARQPEKRPLDIRTSRSMAVEQNSLPPAAVPGAPAPEVQKTGTRTWWLWAGAGAAALVAGGVIYAVTAPEPRPASLGTVPGR